jgi:reactive intermediate/imine deaminase
MKHWLAIGGWICAAALAAVLGWRVAPRVLAADPDIRYLTPHGFAPPVARFSYAVGVPAGQELIFVSGQGGEDSNGALVSQDVVVQTRQTMENLKRVLEAAGSDFAHVVKMNVYLTDMDHMPELRKVRDAYLDPKRAPAMTTAKVLRLVGDIKVEIDLVAVRSR